MSARRVSQSMAILTATISWACVVTASAVPFPGPDNFGYVGSIIDFNLRDVSATGTNIGLDNVDDSVALSQIGFPFSFYGQSYTEVEVSSNGFLTFTPTGNAACCSGEPIPTPGGEIDNYIAGWWQDLAPSVGGIIRTQTLGAPGSREFVVGFYEVRDLDDPANSINTFEIILHEGSHSIELQLAQVQWENVDNKVTGFENADGTDGIEIVYLTSSEPGFSNGDIVFANEGFLFRVPEPSSAVLIVVGVTWLGLARVRYKLWPLPFADITVAHFPKLAQPSLQNHAQDDIMYSIAGIS